MSADGITIILSLDTGNVYITTWLQIKCSGNSTIMHMFIASTFKAISGKPICMINY